MIRQIRFMETILYVDDQSRSAAFYEQLFRQKPDLNVPGMTEFGIAANCKLGLMPNRGIAKIISPALPHPDQGNGIPRCELYLYVDDLKAEYEHAVATGAKMVSEPADRDWGDRVFYLADPDGHVIAFAQKL